MSKEKTEKLKDLTAEYKELQNVMEHYTKLEEEVKFEADKNLFEDSDELSLLHLIQKEMDNTERNMKEISKEIEEIKHSKKNTKHI